MRNRKGSVASVWALVALALLLTACSRNVEIQPGDPDRKTKVVLLARNKQSDFWNTVKMGAEAAAKEYDVNLVFDGADSDDDADKQKELVRQYVAYGMDALILGPSDYAQLAADVDAAARKGVKVVTVDSDVDSGRVSSFIGMDNEEAGRQAAAKLRELAGGDGRFVILSPAQSSRSAMQRIKGIEAEWAGTPGMKTADTLYCGSDLSLCALRARQLLTGDREVDGILALNAAASVGAAETIDSLGLYGKVKLVAFENSNEELEWLQEGVIQATLIQNPFSMGYLSVKTALAAIAKGKVDKRIVTETRLIDSESMFWSDNQKMLFPFVQ